MDADCVGVASKKTLRELMDEKKPLVGAGAYDGFSARLVEESGFDFVYISSMAATASIYGMPDIGMMTLPVMLELTRNISRVVDVPVLVDMEQGYGNYLNAAYNIREFEAAGAQGVLIDDSVPGNVWSVELISGYGGPTGGMPLRDVVGVEEFTRKIRAVAAERRNKSTVISIRCNLRGTKEYTTDAAIQRVNQYVKAGADAIWAAGTLDEKREYARRVKAPLGLITAIVPTQDPVSVKEINSIGIQTVVYTTPPIYMAGKGLLEALKTLRATGNIGSVWSQMLSHDEFNRVTKLKESMEKLGRYAM